MFWFRLIYFVLLIAGTRGCSKSALYYRTKMRTRSHVFAPGEYQPREWEHSVEGSGPLDVRDFQTVVPNKWFVRVDSPDIIFDSEEARWMTEGCRDRLLKLSVQLRNTWAKQDIKIRVLRSWIKPPENYQRSSSMVDHSESVSGEKDNSLRYMSNQGDQQKPSAIEESTSKQSMRQAAQYESVVPNRQSRPKPSKFGWSDNSYTPIVDMTPEMIVGGDASHYRPGYSRNKPFNHSPSAYTLRNYPSNRQVSPSSVDNYWSSWPPAHQVNRVPELHIRHKGRQNRIAASVIYPVKPYAIPPRDRTGRIPRDSSVLRGNISSLTMETMVDSNETNSIRSSDTIATLSTTNKRKHRVVGRSISGGVHPFIMNRPSSSSAAAYALAQFRFEKRMDMRMEEFHYAGRAVDLQLVMQSHAHATRTSNLDQLGKLAQIAYYVAQFDWCHLSRSGHVHCSVKPDTSVTSQWFGCFPSSAEVLTEHGKRLRMSELRIGDRVLTRDLSTDRLLFTPIVAFLHRDAHAWNPVVRITHTDQATTSSKPLHTLYVTPNHLIYTIDRQTGKPITKFASSIRPGHELFLSNQTTRVLNISLITEWHPNMTGLYAPLTETGTLLVDDTLASCFAHFRSTRLSYLVTWPLQWYYRLQCQMQWMVQSLPDKHGLHPYVEWIYQITRPLLPTSLLFDSPT